MIFSALGFWGMLMLANRSKLGLFITLVALSCVEKAASVVNLVAVERDWVWPHIATFAMHYPG